MEANDDELAQDFDAGNCLPIQESGFSFRKSFRKMGNKKLSGTIAFRLRTNVTRALLKENACDDRRLQQNISTISRHQDQILHQQNNLQLNFTFHQRKRRETWQREDRSSLDRLNFPQLHSGDRKLSSASVREVYKTPNNIDKPAITVPLFPTMYGSSEPRIIEYKNHTYLTKQPVVHEINPTLLNKYDKYRGTDVLSNRSVLDERFQKLSTALSEVKSTVRPVRVDNSLHLRSRGAGGSRSGFQSMHIHDSQIQRRSIVPRAATTLM